MLFKQGNRLTRRPAAVNIFFSSFSTGNAENPLLFYIFQLWKAFRKCQVVLRGPIQNQENGISHRPNDHFFSAQGKKFGNACWSKKSHAQTAQKHYVLTLCHKQLGSSSKMELVTEALQIMWSQVAGPLRPRSIATQTRSESVATYPITFHETYVRIR